MKNLEKFIAPLIIVIIFIVLFITGWDRISTMTTFETVGAVITGLSTIFFGYKMYYSANVSTTVKSDDRATLYGVFTAISLVLSVCFLLKVI